MRCLVLHHSPFRLYFNLSSPAFGAFFVSILHHKAVFHSFSSHQRILGPEIDTFFRFLEGLCAYASSSPRLAPVTRECNATTVS